MRRLEALEIVDRVFGDHPVVVTLGATSREMASLGQRPSHLYLLDSMGLAPAVGAGLALADQGPIAVVEGDGSLLMGLSVLPTLAYLDPPKLTLIVLDNHQHASAAGMPSQSQRVSIAELCKGAGLKTEVIADAARLEQALERHRDDTAMSVLVVEIEPGNAPDVQLLLEDPVRIAGRFADALAARGEGGGEDSS
ncbi:MAG: phosphonopyruvate decarboxylase [Actinobacteria bacterium]|nr:phosphonopyruvate decarboxylase [Actinomycetota bacterium]